MAWSFPPQITQEILPNPPGRILEAIIPVGITGDGMLSSPEGRAGKAIASTWEVLSESGIAVVATAGSKGI